MPSIVLSHLCKTFPGPVRAVDDLCLEIGPRELLVLMGPSGCGKTTTLRLLAGLERPTGGQISVAGRDVARLPPRQRNVAMVFQQGALYPHMSVRRNVGFGLRLRGAPSNEIAARVQEAAAALAIAELLERKPGELSVGQQQRVALGRAMASRPQMFLLDEPLSALDAPLRRQLRQEIRRLHQRTGVPMIYVTHDPAEAMALGERIAILRSGRLQQVADSETLYRRPANRFVASLCGNPGMSFFEGRLEASEGRCQLRLSEKFSVSLPDGLREPLAAYAGKSVTLGVRPEHVTLSTEYSVSSTQYTIALPATVEAIEPLGAETLVHLTCENQAFIARVEGNRRPAVGQRVYASMQADDIRFFDTVTEAAIATSPRL